MANSSFITAAMSGASALPTPALTGIGTPMAPTGARCTRVPTRIASSGRYITNTSRMGVVAIITRTPRPVVTPPTTTTSSLDTTGTTGSSHLRMTSISSQRPRSWCS